jgi:LysR family transcriptional regulator, hydrogen peroxide-inducible genes activator
MPTITQLEYAVAVDRCRHFGRAAAMANVSQPTLSAQLQKLEDELGVPLFDRRKRPVLPTEEGKALLEQAHLILNEVRRFEAMADRDADDLSGEFRLGIIPTAAPFLLPRFLSRFSESYPRVELHVEELPTDRLIEQLDRDTLDAGIVATPLGLTRVEEAPLYYEPLQVYVGRDHRLASERKVSRRMLRPEGLWLLSEEHCLREQVIVACGSGDQQGCFPSVHLKGGSMETVVELVSGGQGYTVLPAMAADAIAKRGHEGVVVEFSAPVPAREISLVHRRGYLKRGIEQVLRSTIDACLPSGLVPRTSKGLNVLSLMGQFK